MHRSGNEQSGFLHAELLILMLIVVLAAVFVIPRFQSSTQELRESALRSSLHGMRKAISHYQQQHGHFPGKNTSRSGEGCIGGISGTGDAGSIEAFIDQMGMFTDENGRACSIQVGRFRFGPYLADGKIPHNAVTGGNHLHLTDDGTSMISADGIGLGWKFSLSNGEFIVNDKSKDSKGVAFSEW